LRCETRSIRSPERRKKLPEIVSGNWLGEACISCGSYFYSNILKFVQDFLLDSGVVSDFTSCIVASLSYPRLIDLDTETVYYIKGEARAIA